MVLFERFPSKGNTQCWRSADFNINRTRLESACVHNPPHSFVFLGACSFIITCFHATANAPFGSSFSTRQLALAISAPKRRDAHIIDTECWCCALAVVFLAEVGRGFWLGLVRIWFALLASLHCLPAWFAALCLLSVVSALAGFIHLLVKGTLFWFVCCASRGHRFALGTGGLKQSLRGIGPVYSLPKLCFKPFRRLSAVGFVLGWHREPHLTTLQVP